MLSMFCGKNKGNKKGRVPSEGLDLNLYCAQKVLADSNKNKYQLKRQDMTDIWKAKTKVMMIGGMLAIMSHFRNWDSVHKGKKNPPMT